MTPKKNGSILKRFWIPLFIFVVAVICFYKVVDHLPDVFAGILEFIGIFDAEEQKKRIEYVLKAVGLYKYRKKHADKLSGGQLQRVSIARALLKDSKIIIADEPTGNLDSENSFEVMNILKRISKKTLVLLVTHNNDIDKFYSDRIIQMKDVRIISDEEIDVNETLNHQSDHKIHLLDYQKTELTDEKITINLYSNSDKPVQLNVVVKNDTIYIDSKQKLKIVDGVDIELINDHYQEIKKEELENYDFDISWYQDDKKHKVIIRSHGVGKYVYEELEKYGVQIIDATCPFVKKIHKYLPNPYFT